MANSKKEMWYGDDFFEVDVKRTSVLTIEEQLKSYLSIRSTSERYEVLWHAWKHNKRWLSQLQEWIMYSYPNYSRHDESHCASILHNIEMLLGEKQIRQLSASDCFLILHVVYIHDIGMCITYDDKRALMHNAAFIGFLEEKKADHNGMLSRYADLLLKYCSEMPLSRSESELLNVKLDIYYAILYLISEYERAEHGEHSKSMLDEWVDKPEKLGAGFSTSGIPSRFFYTISACASVHTSYDFNDILALHKEDTGYAHDYMHPRFAAVLLQLGDALDLDNDRFHPLVREFMGELPKNSNIHFGKHKAIRRLRINPQKITIEADCDDPDILRTVSRECENIKDILKHAAYHWAIICPDNLSAVLPNFEPVKLLLNGQEINENLINVKFQIQQKKAFHLLQGSNIYKDDSYVFLREIFQNAIDATKLQYWKDWVGSRWYDEQKKDKITFLDISKRISPLSYPIEIEMHMARKKKYGTEYTLLDQWQDVKGKESEYEYGVVVRVIDHGVGMTAEDIEAISDVGSSYRRKANVVENMPSWLQPTAEFGIGLQAAFLVTDSITAYTHPRTGEKYKIKFQGTGYKGDSCINTMPLTDKDMPLQYGTIFELFVSNEEKKEHKQDLNAWSGRDPFSEAYEQKREYRNARELMMQLATYLDMLIGEKLFPIQLHLYDFKDDGQNDCVENCAKKIHNLLYNCFIDGEKKAASNIEKEEESLTWLYRYLGNKDDMYFGEDAKEQFRYAIDKKTFKLYLWNEEMEVYARFGIDRIQAKRLQLKRNDHTYGQTKMKIFYKGVHVKDTRRKVDADFLEYIDIKGKMKREYLAINRGGFTEAGNEFIFQELYPRVLRASHFVLEKCKTDNELKGQLIQELKQQLDSEKECAEKQNAVLSLTALAFYAQIQSVGEYTAANQESSTDNIWRGILREIANIITDNQKDRQAIAGKNWVNSTLFNLEVKEIALHDEQSSQIAVETKSQNIAEILNNTEHYILLSQRNSRNRSWEEELLYFPSGNKNENISLSGIIERIMLLKKETEWGKRKKLAKEIEQFGNKVKGEVVSRLKGIDSKREPVALMNQTHILNWMLDNLSSIAVFFDESYNIRLNVLSPQCTDSVFFDHNARWAMFMRMREINELNAVERFVQIAPTEFWQLAQSRVPENMYFVKRGKVCIMEQKYQIVPLNASILEKIFRLKKDFRKKIVKKAQLQFFMEYEKYIVRRCKEYKECDEENRNNEERFDGWEKEILSKLDYKEIESKLLEGLSALEGGTVAKTTELPLEEKAEKKGPSAGEEKQLLQEKFLRQVFRWSCGKNKNGQKQTEQIIKTYILPVFKKLKEADGAAQIVSELGESEETLYERLCVISGLKTESGTANEEKKTMQRYISYQAQSNQAGLSERQIEQLLLLYIRMLADDIIQMLSDELTAKMAPYYICGELVGRNNRRDSTDPGQLREHTHTKS